MVFCSSPLGKAVITAAIHTYFAITPGLFAYPVDYVISVAAIGFERHDLIRAVSFAPAISEHTCVAIGGGFCQPEVFLAVGINGILQNHRLRARNIPAPDYNGRYNSAILSFYQGVFDNITPVFILFG